ncbi:Type I restriction endonuclease subunit R [Caenorhabditis elegans]|nr:Type I restriction endonuclease subunit R [Caenorhabditis elegans]CCD69653.1 Type I restriction endonuclease subunit R [Caenorhabditis elegans]|eukprot:NP_001122633.1 Uncharacterized protein CELE_T06D4.1 [Caenorhabditis elegans]
MGKLAEIRELFARTPEDPAFNTPAGIDDSAMNQFYELIRDCRVVPEDDQTFVPRQALATRIHLIIDSFQARRESEFLRQWCQQNIVCLLYGNPVPEMKDFAYRILIEMLTSSSTWTAELESFANELSRKRGTFINDYWATIRDQNEAGDLDPKRTLFADFRDQHSVFGNVQFDIFRERLAQLEKLWHSQMRMFDVPDKVLCVTGIVTDTMTEMLMGVKDGKPNITPFLKKARIFYRLSDGAETSEAPAEASARASEAPEAPALPPKRSRGIKRKLSEYAEELFESKKPKSDELPTAEQWMYFLQHCLQGPEQDEQRGGNQ